MRLSGGQHVGVMGHSLDRDVLSPVDFTDNQWHTLVVDYDGAKLRMWIDGVVAEPGWSVTYETTDNENIVGMTNHEEASGRGYFDGKIRHVTFWSSSSGSLTDPGYGGRAVASAPTWTGSFGTRDSFVSAEANGNINNATVPLPIAAPQGAAPRRFEIRFRTTSTGNMFLLSTGTAESTKTYFLLTAARARWSSGLV